VIQAASHQHLERVIASMITYDFETQAALATPSGVGLHGFNLRLVPFKRRYDGFISGAGLIHQLQWKRVTYFR